MRVCTRCNKSKPLSEFYAKGDGYHYYCISCFKEYQRERNKYRLLLTPIEHRTAQQIERNEKSIIHVNLKRAKDCGLPASFTMDNWESCLTYFDYSCAVCGNQLRGLFEYIRPHADHWIPLSHKDCSGTVPENMICLCSECNMSKHDKDPIEWLYSRYTDKQAQAILARIESYFESIGD